MMLADDLGFDLEEVVLDKLQKNKKKYPMEENKR